MRVSVIVPSRLAINPVDEWGNPFADRALQSIQRQSADHVELEVILALDAVHPPVPDRYACKWIKVSEGGTSQATAVNAAAKLITGDVVAFLEDDDYWDREKLAIQLKALETYDFVSCNQRETDIRGGWIRTNNFPTPSGWLMKRDVWERVGPMDETFKYHVDTEWLGRLNAAKVKRCHLVSPGSDAQVEGKTWLQSVARHSDILEVREITDPLVNRFVHEGSGMAAIARDPAQMAASSLEHATMRERFGEVPW